MKAKWMKISALLLSALTAAGMLLGTPRAKAGTLDAAVLVADYADFEKNVEANNVTLTKALTEEGAPVDRFIQVEATAASASADRGLMWELDNSVTMGRYVMARVVLKGHKSQSEKLTVSLQTADGTQVASAAGTVNASWKTFFLLLDLGAGKTAEVSKVYLHFGGSDKTLKIGDIQLITCGNVKPCGNASGNIISLTYASKSYVDRQELTGQSGLYGSFTRLTVSDVQGEAKNSVKYTLPANTVKASHKTVLRVVARGTATAGGDAQFRVALRNDTNSAVVQSALFTANQYWTEYYIPIQMSADYAAESLYFRIGQQQQTLDIAEVELVNCTTTSSTLPSGKRVLESAPAPAPEEMDFTDKLGESITGKVSYSFADSDLRADDGDMLLFSLQGKGDGKTSRVKVTVQFDSAQTEMEYPFPVQETRINMPITVSGGLKSITLEVLDGPMLLTRASVENRLTATQEDLALESGMHMVDSFTTYKLGEVGVGVGATTDLVSSGNFIYSIGDGKLTVTDMTDPDAPVIRGQVSGMGVTRQIALCATGVDVMVTSRAFGAWIINVSDPDNPVIRSHYDSVEMATGISIEGDYAYISCRQYGVDVVDISDLDDPKNVCVLRTGEVQSCKVVDNILYAGLWGECRVDMYDVTDPANSVLLGSANLTGKGDDTAIYKLGGKTYLFAATGHHAPALGVTTPLSDLRYGQGNGLDIFDVTDPANPQWLSTSKTDGRFYGPSNDYWSVELSQDENGRLFAVLSSTYNGAFIYDVADMTAPVRLAHVYIEIPNTSSNYKTLIDTYRTVVYPFDRTQVNWGPVGAVAVEDGVLYLAGVNTDLMVLKDESLFHAPVEQENNTSINPSGDFYSFDGAGLEGYTAFRNGEQIHSVAINGEYVFAAASDMGILVFDKDLNLFKTIPASGCCYDVYIRDGVLYASEGMGGLVAYSIEGTELTEQWRYTVSGQAVKQARLSATGKFAMLHISGNQGHIIRVSDRNRLVKVTAGSQMYHHNVINEPVAGRYMCFWANSTDERWYDFGENDSFDTPVLVSNTKPPRPAMTGGVESLGDLAIITTGTGYYLYDPALAPETSSLKLYKPGQNISGKPSENQGTLITTNRIKGLVYIMDVSTPTDPKLLGQFSVPGHPDIAVFGINAVYIPMGYQGLIRFDWYPQDESLKFSGASVVLQDDLALNFKANESILAGYSDPYVVFSADGRETKVEGVLKDGTYVFSFRDIAPDRLGDTVTAILYATKDGQVAASAPRSYSVQEYCLTMMEKNPDDTELCNLLADILHYGAAAQAYTGYNTGSLVNSGVTGGTEGTPELADHRSIGTELENPEVTWNGGGLRLEESIAVRLKFTAADTAGLEAKLFVDGEEVASSVSFLPTGDKEDQHYVYFRCFTADRMRQQFQVVFYRGDAPVSNTLNYSMESYICSMANGTETSQALKDLVIAAIRYGDSVSAYVK